MKRFLLTAMLSFAALSHAQNYMPNIDRGPAGTHVVTFAEDSGRAAVMETAGPYLVTIPEAPGSAAGSTLDVEVWDMFNPSSPRLVQKIEKTNNPFLAHGMIKNLDFDGNPQLFTGRFPNNAYKFTGAPLMTNERWDGNWPHFLFPMGGKWGVSHWWSYNSVSGDAYIRNNYTDETVATWDHLGDTGVIGFPHTFGDTVIFASDQSNTGLASYDISDPSNPVLLQVFNADINEYDQPGQTDIRGIGGYWSARIGDKIIFASRASSTWAVGRSAMIAVDVSDPENMSVYCYRPVGMYNTPWGSRTWSAPMYVGAQDNTVFVGDAQIDISTPDCNIVREYDAYELGIDASQYARPLGNIIVFGGAFTSFTGQGAIAFVSQDGPDLTPPYVSDHIPRHGQTNYSRSAQISLHIPETLRAQSMTKGVNMQVRTVAGTQVDFAWELTHTGTLQITPGVWTDNSFVPTDLAANTEYVVEMQGILDYAGNAMQTCRYAFSTGAGPVTTTQIEDGCTVPVADNTGGGNTGGNTGGDTGGNTGTVPDPSGPLYFPSQSSELVCLNNISPKRVWTVNPDNNSVTIINDDNESVIKEIRFPYKKPTSVGLITATSQPLYPVTYEDSDTIVFYDLNGNPVFSKYTGYGSRPTAVITRGVNAYVSLYGDGKVIRIDASTQTISGAVEVGPTPKAMAFSPNADELYVTRHISTQDYGQVYEVNTSTMTLTRTMTVNRITSPPRLDGGPGIPNMLSSIVVNESGTRAYITAIKQNTGLGALVDDDNAVRAMMVTLELQNNRDLNIDPSTDDGHHDFDNHGDAAGITYSPDAAFRFAAMRANNKIIAMRDSDNTQASQFDVGFAPQHMCTMTRSLYVKNLTGRSVSKVDIAPLMATGAINPVIVEIPTVTNELLSDDELLGKKLFYHAEIPRISAEGYISCASCHADSGADGQAWDFSVLGEGLRNTISLNGGSGTRFGNLHWSANFDEVQDFNFQIHNLNVGDGFVDNFDASRNPTQVTTTGLNSDLDALSAYVSSLGKDSLPKSKWRLHRGELSPAAQRGKIVFDNDNCASCHTGSAFRDGRTHDVGTIKTSSGQRLGGILSSIRTPTLVGLHDTAPYFHDGSAKTLGDVFKVGAHARTFSDTDESDLIQYLYSLDPTDFINDNEVFTPVAQ